MTDGPFAPTKESFFSFIIIDVADLDTALGWAKHATRNEAERRALITRAARYGCAIDGP